jgi:hypothetical protein
MIRSIPWDGKTITADGIYSGIPLDQYHRGDICDAPSVSSSGLRKLWMTSPAHFWDTSPLNPNRSTDDDDKEAFTVGRAAHLVCCGEPGFADQFVIRPTTIDGEPWHGNKRICKAWLADRKREGKTVLTEVQTEAVTGMAVALGNNALVQAGILNGLIERSMFHRDPETGLWLKARPDAIPNDSGDFADLKTTPSVMYLDLRKTITEFAYQMQAGLVMEIGAAIGIEASTFTFLFVEKKRPYCTRAMMLKDEDILRGFDMNRAMRRTVADCLQTGVWPGPGADRADAEHVDLADWSRKQIDDRLKLQLREAA